MFAKILIAIPVLYIFIMPSYFEKRYSSRLCRSIVVTIADTLDYQFVSANQIVDLINSRSDSILGRPVNEISIEKIEDRILSLHELREAEIYIDIEGNLNIYIDQRNPILRVIPNQGGDYFLDDEGVIFKKNTIYSPRLHVAGGDISISRKMLEGVSIFDTTIHQTVLRDLSELVTFINGDEFWSAQIDQMYVDDKNCIEMISRLGDHTIKLGTIENFEEKMRNLGALYEQVMPIVGWNRYSVIDLGYKDQVICKR